MEETTITITGNHGFMPIDSMAVATLDMRWWKRLWHFITFRQPPIKIEQFTITAISGQTITVQEPLLIPNTS